MAPGPDDKKPPTNVRRLERRIVQQPRSPRNPTGLDEDAIQTAARKAVARMPQSGGRVQIAATVALTVEEAEWLTARAIREGKSVRGLIAELVRAAAVEGESP
jgi:hypothetical protein